MSKSEGKSGSACSQPVSAPKSAVGEGEPSAAWREYRTRERRIRAYQFREAMVFAHLLDGVSLPPGVVLGSATYHRERREVSHWRAWVLTMHDQRVYLSDGDWIVPEPVADRFYPVKPQVFDANYEPALSSVEPALASERSDECTSAQATPEHSTSDEGERKARSLLSSKEG